MERERKRTIKKVANFLKLYKDDNSIYYKELKKTYNEYKSFSDDVDPKTLMIYERHIDELCNYIKKRNKFDLYAPLLLMASILILITSCITSYRYYSLSMDMNKTILRHNRRASILFHHSNYYDYEIKNIGANEYMNLSPIILQVSARSEENEDYLVHYDIYLTCTGKCDKLEYNIIKEGKVVKSSLMSYISVNKDGRRKIFSADVMTSKTDNLELRIWSLTDSNNDDYKLDLYVDSHVA